MWWCCGKFGKDTLGCKFSCHESKGEDEEELEDEITPVGDIKNGKYIRCLCCKEIGHSIENCTRDPNLKTNAKAEYDIIRI